ncbi:hypothetical protein D3C83_46060 [compost metagenome]
MKSSRGDAPRNAQNTCSSMRPCCLAFTTYSSRSIVISAPSILRMSVASASGYRYENASMSTRFACRLKNSVSDLIA